MKIIQVVTLFCVVKLGLLVSGCSNAEQASDAIGDAARDAVDTVEDAGHNTADAINDAANEVENAIQ